MLTGPSPDEVRGSGPDQLRESSTDEVVDFPPPKAASSSLTMLLTHAFSNRLWQRACALSKWTMTRVIVKGTRESVSDR
jgi:hypothetical protein